MIIDLTYACKMGCSHCMSDCKPEGENISLQQLSFSYKTHTSQGMSLFSSFGIRFFYFLKSDKCYVSILDM